MAYSSILGADPAPVQPRGRDSDALGPSDNSDTGSDARGTREVHADSDGPGTGERAGVFGGDFEEGADIAPDRVVHMGAGGEEEEEEAGPGSGNGFPEADPDSQEFTDLDSDSEPEADGDAQR
ncbi:hypothetical protein [Ramlibacter sp.]|uniref:hypothetical protein n=1 Tax=Ramlibacter sp. TaxID=1917967 RepID=UPI002FCA03AC